MATRIPALGACVARVALGERRLAERLEQSLEDNDSFWWSAPISTMQTRRGALIHGVKDSRFEIVPDSQLEMVRPLVQARHHTNQIVNKQKYVRVAQARRTDSGPDNQQPTSIRRCAEHMPLHAKEEFQPEERRHPGVGLENPSEDQLSQYAADVSVGLSHGWQRTQTQACRCREQRRRYAQLKPLSYSREGPRPIVVNLTSLPKRAVEVAEPPLADQHTQGDVWDDMSVLC